MTAKTVLRLSVAAALIGYGAQRAICQVGPGALSDANHPSGAPDPEKLDQVWSVDPINDQLSVKIPFASVPQGGRGPKAPFALLYNSGSTVTLQANGVVGLGYGAQSTIFKWAAHPLAYFGSLTAPSGPWTTTGPYFYSGYSVVPDYNVPNGMGGTILAGAGCTTYGPYTYVDENGDSHDLNILGFSSSYTNPSAWAPSCGEAKSESATYWPSSTTTDGSGMQTISGGNGGATTRDGTVAIAGKLTDPNSNSMTLTTASGVTTATDAMGRTVYKTNIPIGQPGQIPAGTYYVETYGENGATETYTVVFQPYTLPSFTGMLHPTTSEISSPAYCTSCTSSYTISQPGGDTYTAIAEVDLPDGVSKYSFTYGAPYGMISKITFPTGGYVRFQWSIRDKDWSPYGQFEAISSIVVTEAFVSSDGITEDNWSYALNSLSNSSTPIGVVTSPDRTTVTKYTGQCFIYTSVPLYRNQARASCKEASHATYSGTTPIESQVETFATSNSHGLPLQVATTAYDGPSPMQKHTVFYYDTWDNVTEKDESDFFSCTPSGGICPAPSLNTGPWLRKTYTAYVYSSQSSLATAHIVDKPSQITTTDISGTPYSLTTFSGYDSHGNLGTQGNCLSIGGTGSSATCSSPWNTHFTWDATGQLKTKVEGYQTGKDATTTNTWGGTGGGDLITVLHPNGATDNYTYSAYTGQMLSHTDWNGNVTNYDYGDPLNRLTSVTAPPTVDGTTGTSGHATTSYSYSDSPGDFSVQEQHSVDMNGVETSTTTNFDGLGRKINSKTVTPDCTSSIEVDTVYDSMSRVHTVSNPYCSTSDSTYGQTIYDYDALGRKIQITTPDNVSGSGVTTISYGANATKIVDPFNGNANPTHIQQVDGIGRLAFLCEVSASTFGGTVPSSCGLNIAGSGFLTSYFYDPLGNLSSVSQHGISRSFNYDSLSRLTNATNPETGLVSYVYSIPSAACSPDPTVPCSKTDARSITTSYVYDSLSRLTAKAYAGNSGTTPISCYQYDSSSVAGAGVNLKGHLTNAWTQAGSPATCPASPGTFITLRSFLNFDAMERLTSAQQQTCAGGKCSGPSPYQIGMSYDLASNVTALSNSVGANNLPLTTTTYFDAASRPCLTTSTWTSIASANIFQVTPGTAVPGYSPAGGLQNYYLGSSISNAQTSCGISPNSPINVAQFYNKRFWVSSISASGQIP